MINLTNGGVMPGVRNRGEMIRHFILENVGSHQNDIVLLTSNKFNISRQAVNAHLRKLIKQKSIVQEGKTRNISYRLHPFIEDILTFPLSGLEEDRVWRDFVRPQLGELPDNIIDIWSYGFTEMLNNAIDHSQGKYVLINVKKYPVLSEISITDDGFGIFRRIQQILNLHDERHAVLELSKGKLTTDPDNHTGEGIFFSSRMFDEYAILSGGVYFSHEYNKPEDWIIERNTPSNGTAVFMQLSNNSSRKIKSIFDEYTSGDDYSFDKTVVPVSLARYGTESLVSRSQAKRLLARIDRFKIVIFDFDGIDQIGQAFADQVFRVFKKQHPEIQIYFTKTNHSVENMIVRALSSGIDTKV
jgi:anti-sigma regulatory factor (Ser/Thr protein kinase)